MEQRKSWSSHRRGSSQVSDVDGSQYTPSVDYEAIVEAMGSIVFELDGEGVINYMNHRAERVLDCYASNIVGTRFVDSFMPASVSDIPSNTTYRANIERHIQEVLDSAETVVFQCGLKTCGSPSILIDMLISAAPRFDCQRNVLGCVLVGTDVTNHASEKISSEHVYSRILERANAPIFGVDTHGKINIWNKKAAEITQYAPEEVMGLDLVDTFISPDYRQAVGAVLSEALNGIETANFEFLLDTKSGTRQVAILLNATSRYDEVGNVVGVVGIGQDITDRVAQEQEYARLIDKANAPIFGVDEKLRVNIWNRKIAEITQYSIVEVMGENIVDKFISEDYRPLVSHVLSQALKGYETADFEVPLVTKTGRKVNILLNATSRFDQMGCIIGVVGIGQDITDRIAQEQEYTRLIDTANAPIFGVDQNGLVNIWNKKAAEITQYTQKEVMGQNLVEKFISEDYRKAVGYVLSKALNGVETANFEFPLITKTDRRVEILLNATPRYNELGKVMGMVGIGQDITDRIAQEQEYTRLIDKANAPIFGVDQHGSVNIWNKKAAEITQYTQDEAMAENLVDKFISEDYRFLVSEVFSKALKGIETANFEFPLVTKADRRVQILLNATPRYNELGDVIGVVGIGQDITERIAQEQEYSRLIDTANAPIFGVDKNMRVNIWNKKAAQITHYSIAEVMGENLVETFISPEYRPIVADVLSKALNGIQTANFEFPLITRPGSRIEILLNATPRNDLHGNIVGVVGIGQDITDRISQEHEYFRLIDSANAPIFGVDTQGKINEWNQKIEEITGYKKASILGMSLVDTFIIPESREQVRHLLNEALLGLDVGEMELPILTKIGTFLLLLVNASSKKDFHGNIRGVIGVGQDYTARKQMEAAKVNFLASFSHELRTPLNGVLGMLELLKEQKLGDVPSRYVHMAYVSGSLLLNLINDILDLSKIEAGHLEIQSAPFQLEDLLDYTIELFKFKAHERGLKLSVVRGNNVPEVVIGDVIRLRQILLNLLSNAIKFTVKGSITVKCTVVQATPEMDKTQRKLLFQVIDTGVGMNAEEKSRLFSLFTKLERTRKNNPTGSGLGLAICKQLVELMDGQIDVDSELGVGSTFFFSVIVRLAPDDFIAKMDAMKASALLAVSPSHHGRKNRATTMDSIVVQPPSVPKQARILVVEDNDFNWEVVKCFLQDDDHYLQWETNGQLAVDAYIAHHDTFDLVFMDCEMPVMDGYTATQAIRQFELENGLDRIPILGLTAYAMSGDREKCLEAGMDEFIVKPIAKSSLLKTISYWMRRRYIPSLRITEPRFVLADSSSISDIGPSPVGSMDEPAVLLSSSRRTPSTPQRNSHLLPASNHTQELDLVRAISDLELEDPMMMGRHRMLNTTYEDQTSMTIDGAIGGNSLTITSNSGGSTKPAGSSMFSLGNPQRASFTTSSFTRASPLQKMMQDGLSSPITSKTFGPFNETNRSITPPHRKHTSNSLPDVTKLEFKTEVAQDWQNWREQSVASSRNLMDEKDNPLFNSPHPSDAPPAHVSSAAVLEIEIPEGDPVDYSLGVSQCGGNEELFISLLGKYSLGLDIAVHRLDEAYNSKDLYALRREAHSLKGSSAYVAAMRVSKAAYRVQVCAEQMLTDQPDMQLYLSSYEFLQDELRALKGYLRRNFSFHQPSMSMANSKLDTKGTTPCNVM
ncbi:hybrid signal transduction histidine kinase [Thraustotheca clavata]|uniref:histidine kinase n=1 Tax=Thraustotheca clavata TaxID=74557 RepID=A0A1V9ZY03_9STRA|nr:hybrid signal transduction histidine kinase [Thraustotheca clavata]